MFTRISPVILIILLAVHTSAVPPLPAEFYGSLFLDGSPAPVGTVITAQILGIDRGSLVTEVPGFYGGPGLFDTRLKVNVSEEEYNPGGMEIIFMINGRQAEQQAVFEAGSSGQLDLSTGGGGTGTPAAMIPSQDTPPARMITPVYEGSSPSSSSGSGTMRYGLDQSQVFSSDDGLAEISFERDTMLLTPEGQFLTVVALRSRNIADIPSVPVGSPVIFSGYAYEIIPSGTSFNPKGTLTLTLPPERAYQLIQAGPALYRFIPQTGIWEPVVTDANVFANTITAEIPDATIYGLFTHAGTNETGLNTTPGGMIVPAARNAQIDITGNNSTVSSQVIPLPVVTPEDILTPLPGPVTSQSRVTPLTVPQDAAVTPLPAEEVQIIKSEEDAPTESVSLPPGEDAGADTPGQPLSDHPVFRIIALLLLIVLGNLAVYLIYARWWIHR